MTVLRVVLGDQLSPAIAALSDLDPARDVVLMAEVLGECSYVRHHKQKIVLVLSAMRHFAAALGARGVRVAYTRLDDAGNTQSLGGEVARAARAHGATEIVVTEPGEWRVRQDMLGWGETAGVPVEIRTDTRFLCGQAEFRAWARDRRGRRMEFFYRDMRRRHDVLMQDGAPLGGQWNFDAENRKRLPAAVPVPAAPRFAPDGITQEVMALVRQRFSHHFGRLEGFALPVTARDARAGWADFLAHRLPGFGDWQDAMRADAPVLFHSLVATSLNLGLLDPLALCRDVAAEHAAGRVALNAAEGFIRQILGWREYVRGLYWLHMPEYGRLNALAAQRPLPGFYWSGETRMRCLAQAIGQTRDHAYAHHIQRLMITGNFALLAGVDPDAVDEWYLAVYADAYEWVELPNTRGMALFADGGIVGSKPYAASGAYINRMSDYCSGCAYDVQRAVGEGACPFNALYWDFIGRHEERFAGNPRMAMPVRSWQRMAADKRAGLVARARGFLAALDRGEIV